MEQIEPYYGVNHMVASLLFLSPFAGYVAAALMVNMVHHHVGQRGVALIGPICRIISYITMLCHAPFPALVVMMLSTGFAGGLQDSSWNAWIGNLQNANELLGFLHGCYGAGATVSPLIASAMVADRGFPWYTYYYIMVGVAVLDLGLQGSAFWGATSAVFRAEQAQHRQDGITESGDDHGTKKGSPLGKALKSPITWLLSFLLLAYVGIEVSLGGWLVTFMLDVRGAAPFAAGLSATGFWLGITVGRIVMGFVVGRLGEKAAITVCLALCIGLQLVYWLVPNFIASAVAVSFIGFLLGPLFATAIVVAAKLLPAEYHVPAIGFVSAFGGGGGAVLPFVFGVMAEQKGVQSLQYLALAAFIFIISLWVCLPGGMKRGGLERARANNEKVGHQIRSLISNVRGRSKRTD
jgi:fucose permease